MQNNTLTAYSWEIECVGFKTDIPEVSEHGGLNMTGYLAGLDVHSSSVDFDFRIDPVVHRFVWSGVKGDLRTQIFHACIVGAMSHDLLLILLQDFRIVTDALDEQNAITQLTGEVIVDLRALSSRNYHGVQELETRRAPINRGAISQLFWKTNSELSKINCHSILLLKEICSN